jgi:hypothetical protein
MNNYTDLQDKLNLNIDLVNTLKDEKSVLKLQLKNLVRINGFNTKIINIFETAQNKYIKDQKFGVFVKIGCFTVGVVVGVGVTLVIYDIVEKTVN